VADVQHGRSHARACLTLLFPPPCTTPLTHVPPCVVQKNHETIFKVKRHTKMKKVFAAYAARKGLRPESLRFMLDGTRVQPDDTPEAVRCPAVCCWWCWYGLCHCVVLWRVVGCELDTDKPSCQQLELEDEDQIDVVLYQEGGCC